MNDNLEEIKEKSEHTLSLSYASFAQRFYASCVASIIITLSILPFSLIVAGVIYYFYGFEIFKDFSYIARIHEDESVKIGIIQFGLLIFFSSLMQMLYYSYYLSSPQQATPGMKLHGLKLIDNQGRSVSFGRALLREIAAFFSFWFFLIGYFMIGWTSRRQAFHDIVTSTYVINTFEEQNLEASMSQLDQNYRYGGFGRRFGACIVDTILCVIAGGLPFLVEILSVNRLDDYENAKGLAISFIIFSQIISYLTPLLYYVFFTCSRYQATPGKMLFSLKVTDLEGQKLTLFRSLIRHAANYYSAFIFGIGYLMVAFTKRSQGLHDKIARTYVIHVPKISKE